MTPEDVRQRADAIRWYHTMDLGHGVVTNGHGTMLGVFPDAQYTNAEIAPFGAGDRLLLYSDGVSEARDRGGRFFDEERVARWMSHFEHTSAERFADAALQELTRWTGGSFEDDVTFVIAARPHANQAQPVRSTPHQADRYRSLRIFAWWMM